MATNLLTAAFILAANWASIASDAARLCVTNVKTLSKSQAFMSTNPLHVVVDVARNRVEVSAELASSAQSNCRPLMGSAGGIAMSTSTVTKNTKTTAKADDLVAPVRPEKNERELPPEASSWDPTEKEMVPKLLDMQKRLDGLPKSHLALKLEGLDLRFDFGTELNEEYGEPGTNQTRGAGVLAYVGKEAGISQGEISRRRAFAQMFTDFADFRAKYPKVTSWDDVKKLVVKEEKDASKEAEAKLTKKASALFGGLGKVDENLAEDVLDELPNRKRRQVGAMIEALAAKYKALTNPTTTNS